jgi:hypothetical protein
MLKPTQLEQELRKKLDILGYKTGTILKDNINFGFNITDFQGVTITVVQQKANSDIIRIIARFTFTPQKTQIDALSPQKQKQLLNDLLLVAGSQGISYGSSSFKEIPVEDILLKEDLKDASLFIRRGSVEYFV